MRFLRQLFIPQRADAVTLLTGILVVMASVCITLMIHDEPKVRRELTPAILTPFMLTVLCSIAFAIGAAGGCKQISLCRMGILLIATIPLWALAIWATIQVLNRSTSGYYHRFGGGDSFYSHLPFRYDQLGMYYFAFPLVAAASFLANWFLSLVIDRLIKRKASPESDRQSRIRWMIGFAGLLFSMHLINQFSEMNVARAFLSTATALLPFLFSYWICETLTGTWRWLRFFFTLVLLPVLSIPFWNNSSEMAAILTVAIPALFGLLAAGSGVSRNQLRNSEQMNNRGKQGHPFMRISLWGLIPALALAGLAAFPWLIHIPTLMTNPSIEVAWRTAQFARSTESRCIEYDGFTAFEFDFSKRNSPSSLTKVDKLFSLGMENPLPQTMLVLKNLHSNVETNLSNFSVTAMILENGSIDTDQLAELASTSRNAIVLKNLTVIRGDQIKPELSQWFLNDMSAVQMQAFFDSLDRQTVPFQFYIQTVISPEHWPIIAKASLRHHINLNSAIAGDDLKNFQRVPVGNLIFWQRMNPAALLQSDAFCDSDLSFDSAIVDEADFRPLSSVLEAKLLLRGLRCRSEAYESINDWTNDKLLVFDRDKAGEPIGLLCPFPISSREFPTKGLENLKTLVLGVEWLNSSTMKTSRFGGHEVLWPETFSKMPNLERLAISSDIAPLTLGFLSELPQLKHLELSMHNTSSDNYPLFEFLPALERLTVHNDVEEDFFKALSVLKSLKQLTLVLPDESDLSAADAAKALSPEKMAAKYLPAVEFTLVKSKDFRPEIPASFKDHFTPVIQELKARIAAWKEGNLKKD